MVTLRWPQDHEQQAGCFEDAIGAFGGFFR